MSRIRIVSLAGARYVPIPWVKYAIRISERCRIVGGDAVQCAERRFLEKSGIDFQEGIGTEG